MQMKTERKRFAFVDWFGIPRGIENTDSLLEAVENANEFQCEVLDTQDDNQVVYNCWSGWNKDWRKRNGKERL